MVSAALRVPALVHGSPPGGQEGLDSGNGGFFVSWILGNDRCSLLILVDNYNRAATDQTTKARRHKGRTRRFVTISSFAIHAGYRKQRRAATRP
ncbi:MAG: hypothetical protein WCW68_03290 [Methanothrix sp.]